MAVDLNFFLPVKTHGNKLRQITYKTNMIVDLNSFVPFLYVMGQGALDQLPYSTTIYTKTQKNPENQEKLTETLNKDCLWQISTGCLSKHERKTCHPSKKGDAGLASRSLSISSLSAAA